MQTKFTDEELTAYLDGEYEYTRADDINKALAHDNELKARLEQLSFGKDDLKIAFDDMLSSTPHLADNFIEKNTLPNKTGKQPSLAAVAAVAFLCFGLGLAANFILPKTHSLDSWQQYVAAYQALYINSTLSHVENNAEQKQRELQRIALALGKEIKLNELESLQQLDYKRAQILGYKGQALAQLTFLSSMDAPIALCIIRSNGELTEGIKMAELEGMSAASWNKNGYSYLLIGGNDTRLINEMANRFAAYL